MTRVAIVGARGVGRHHAAWWEAEGGRVCGFAAGRPETVATTAALLAEHLGHPVPGYASVVELLAEARPAVLDVCSPDALHGAHVRAGLEAGCHVLCEKPFLSDSARSARELLDEARALAGFVEARGLLLGVCTQYAAGFESMLGAAGLDAAEAVAQPYAAHLASPARGRAPDPVGTWCDLGPHLISVLARAHTEGEIDWRTLRIEAAPWVVTVQFRLNGQPCTLTAERRESEPLHLRRFAFGDAACDVTPETGPDGRFAMRLLTPRGAVASEDFMRLLIRRFLAGDVVNPARTHLRELAWLLRIRDAIAARVDNPAGRGAE